MTGGCLGVQEGCLRAALRPCSPPWMWPWAWARTHCCGQVSVPNSRAELPLSSTAPTAYLGVWVGVTLRGMGFAGHEYALDCLTFASLLELDNPALEQKLRWVMQQRQEKRSTVRPGGRSWQQAPPPQPLAAFPIPRRGCCTLTPSCMVGAVGEGGSERPAGDAEQLPPQCPSTLGEEQTYNPFLRTHRPELQAVLGLRQSRGEHPDAFRARVFKEVRKSKDLYKAT